MTEKIHYIKLRRGKLISKPEKEVMNLPEPISYFMTSSCWSCLSISEQVINIKMKFFLHVLSKASNINCFHKCFLLQAVNASSSIFYQKQSCSDFSLIRESSLSFVVFFFFFSLSWQKVHEYHFTHDCGCISINQEIKSKCEGYIMALQSS